jgi:hypothetical protein
MSANYIGAFGPVNIGQFDVKRLAQIGCVETNESCSNFAIVVDTASAGHNCARASTGLWQKPRHASDSCSP